MDRVAVIGLGNIAVRHRHNLRLLYPWAKIYAMPSSRRTTTDPISNCDLLVSNVNQLISHRLELVIVASPAPFHAQHAIPLIEAGIPTLIEKPVTTSIEDVKRIRQAIDKYQTPVTVGYCLRYLPSAMKLHTLLKKEKLGILYNANIEIGQYLPDWRPSKNYRDCVSANKNLGGGALFELSHELDYSQWLLGPLAFQHAVLRSSLQLNLEVEDLVDIFAVNSMNTVVTIHLDFIQPKAHRRCSFVGSEGRLNWDLLDNKLELIKATETVVLYHEPEWDKNLMYLAMIEDFVCKIRGGNNTSMNIRDAELTVSLIDEIKQNASYIKEK